MTRIARRNAPSFELALQPRTVYNTSVLQPAAAAQAAAVSKFIQKQQQKSTTSTSSTSTTTTSSFGASDDDAFSPSTSTSAASMTISPQWTIYDGPSKITSNLYLGSQSDAGDKATLMELGIKRILNVAGECAVNGDIAESFNVKHVCLRDHSDENIAAHFDECVAFIREAVEASEPVLVHCRMGVSRSTTIVLAYIMRYGVDDVTASTLHYTAAFDFVKSLRPQVSPNLGFVLSLHQLDRERGFRTPDEDLFDAFEQQKHSRAQQQHLF